MSLDDSSWKSTKDTSLMADMSIVHTSEYISLRKSMRKSDVTRRYS